MSRSLTPQEQAELSPGLWEALVKAGVEPRLRARPFPAAYLVALWRGGLPVMAVGRTIWWPGLPGNLAGTIRLSVLQHELQHLLDYGEGKLSITTYLLNPHNWIYSYDLARQDRWDRLGAEQRASMAENLWRLERSGDAAGAARLRAIIPWARP
jgi:hypothetical protein